MTDKKVDWFYCGNCRKDTVASVSTSIEIGENRIVIIGIRFTCDTCDATLYTTGRTIELEP